jgi:hypothetical protein
VAVRLRRQVLGSQLLGWVLGGRSLGCYIRMVAMKLALGAHNMHHLLVNPWCRPGWLAEGPAASARCQLYKAQAPTEWACLPPSSLAEMLVLISGAAPTLVVATRLASRLPHTALMHDAHN